MTEEKTLLEKTIVLLAEEKKKNAELTEFFEFARGLLGPYSLMTPPKSMQVPGREVLLVGRGGPIIEMEQLMLRAHKRDYGASTAYVHIRATLGDGAAVYTISQEAIDRLPRHHLQELLQMEIARQLAFALADHFKPESEA